MIEKFSLYYAYKTIGDVLIVNIEPDLFPTSYVKKGDVVAIYNNEKLIGYNIFSFSRVVKIKMVGILYHPENVMIDIINSMLTNAGLETLAYVKESGFVVGEVKECIELEHDFMTLIDIKDRIVAGLNKTMLNPGDKVVVAKEGTTLRDGKIVKQHVGEYGMTDCHICSGKDVFYDETETTLLLDKDIENGIDFFKIEVE